MFEIIKIIFNRILCEIIKTIFNRIHHNVIYVLLVSALFLQCFLIHHLNDAPEFGSIAMNKFGALVHLPIRQQTVEKFFLK